MRAQNSATVHAIYPQMLDKRYRLIGIGLFIENVDTDNTVIHTTVILAI